MSKLSSRKKHFLQVEFENKFAQEDKDRGNGKQLQQHTIGSCHNPKMDYDVDECFFVKEDIPEEKRIIHKEIKDLIDPDYLGYASAHQGCKKSAGIRAH